MDVLSQIGPFAKFSMLVSVLPIGVAIAYAIRPSERTLVLLRPVSLAVIFAAICGFASGISLTFRYLAETPAGTLDLPRAFAGLAEAFLPAFVSFGLLAVAWLLAAVGMLRRTP